MNSPTISPSLAFSLGKVLAAVAWADGKIEPQERDCIQDMLFYLPDLKAEQMQEINDLLGSLISQDQALRFTEDLVCKVQTEKDRDFVLYSIGQIMQSDGFVSQEEEDFYKKISQELYQSSTSLMQSLKSWFEGLVSKRKEKVSEVLKNQSLSRFIQNKIKQLQSEYLVDKIQHAQLYKMCLAGILMARILWADGRATQGEMAVVGKFLQKKWDITSQQANGITQLLMDPAVNQLDLLRVCRSFFDVNSIEERGLFLRTLFEIAQSDGIVTKTEIDQIVDIAANLKIEQDQFNDMFNECIFSSP